MQGILNQRFDCVFCINLATRADRWEAASHRFSAAGVDVERFDAVPAASVPTPDTIEPRLRWTGAVKACAASHIAAVREAQRRGARSVFLFQDDVTLHPRFEGTLRDWLVDLPRDWDLLYLGGWHPRTARDGRGRETELPRPEHVRGHVYRLRHDFCLHACGIRDTLFEEILSIDPDTGEPIDCSFVRLFQSERRCYGLMTAAESRPGAWGLAQQDHSLGSNLREAAELERFHWPGWSLPATEPECVTRHDKARG